MAETVWYVRAGDEEAWTVELLEGTDVSGATFAGEITWSNYGLPDSLVLVTVGNGRLDISQISSLLITVRLQEADTVLLPLGRLSRCAISMTKDGDLTTISDIAIHAWDGTTPPADLLATNLAATDLLLLQKGQPNGIATLDAGSLVPFTQVPIDLLRPPKVRQISEFVGADFTAKMQAAATWLRGLEVDGVGGAGTRICSAAIDLRGLGVVELTASINLQNINAFGWAVLGEGTVIHVKTTGRAAFDALGSRWGHFHMLTMFGDETARPMAGIMIGRITADALSADCYTFTTPNFSGFWTHAPICNLASETATYIHPTLFNYDDTSANRCAFLLDGMNHFGLVSDFTAPAMPVDVAMSCLQQIIIGGDFRQMVSGPAMRAAGLPGQLRFIGSYMVSFDDSLIDFLSAGANVYSWDFDVHGEPSTMKRALKVDRTASGAVTMHGFRWREHNFHGTDEFIRTGNNAASFVLLGCDVEVLQSDGAITNGHFAKDNGANSITVSGPRFHFASQDVTGATQFSASEDRTTGRQYVGRHRFVSGVKLNPQSAPQNDATSGTVYIDAADGSLKVKFPNNTIKVITTNV